MGYLIGQIGGLLPIPGGVGGIDGGLIGTLIVYGAPAAATPPPCCCTAWSCSGSRCSPVRWRSRRCARRSPTIERPDLCFPPTISDDRYKFRRAGRYPIAMDLEALRAELKALLASWDYAYAMGHGCSVGDHPQHRAIRQKVADLKALIAEHAP